MEGITSRRVLVTGAAGGIGAAVAAAFEANGAHVHRIDLLAAGGAEVCDVTDEVAVACAFAAVGPLDHVVHAAGIVAVGRVADTSADEFRRVLGANAVGSFVVAREASRWLQRGGTLTLISSQGGRKGWCGLGRLLRIKFAVVGARRVPRAGSWPRGIRGERPVPRHDRHRDDRAGHRRGRRWCAEPPPRRSVRAIAGTSPLDGSARPRTSPAPACCSPRHSPASLPAPPSSSTEASCHERGRARCWKAWIPWRWRSPITSGD